MICARVAQLQSASRFAIASARCNRKSSMRQWRRSRDNGVSLLDYGTRPHAHSFCSGPIFPSPARPTHNALLSSAIILQSLPVVNSMVTPTVLGCEPSGTKPAKRVLFASAHAAESPRSNRVSKNSCIVFEGSRLVSLREPSRSVFECAGRAAQLFGRSIMVWQRRAAG